MNKKYKKSGELVVVTWHDAFSSNQWTQKTTLQDVHKSNCRIRTIGEVFKHDQKGITLINGLDKEAESFSGYFHVPATYIQKIEKATKKKYWSCS